MVFKTSMDIIGGKKISRDGCPEVAPVLDIWDLPSSSQWFQILPPHSPLPQSKKMVIPSHDGLKTWERLDFFLAYK
jgi:hypothetical protein